MADSGPIPANARTMWAQSTAGSLPYPEGFFGQAYYNLGPKVPGDYIPTFAPGPVNTGSNIAVFDPATFGVASVYRRTGPVGDASVATSVAANVMWMWDMQAIAAAAGAVLDLAVGIATLTLTVVASSAPVGPVSPGRIYAMDDLVTPVVEPTVAPHIDSTEPGSPFTPKHYVASPYAWAEPSGADPGNPNWFSAGVSDPASTWGSGWAALMDTGGPAGSEMRLPKMPVRPLSSFAVVDHIPAGSTGTWSTGISMANAVAGRWMGVWASTDAQAENEDYINIIGASPPDTDIDTWWDYGLIAYLTVPFLGGRAAPLWQRQRIGVLDSPEQYASGLVTPQSSPWQGGTL